MTKKTAGPQTKADRDHKANQDNANKYTPGTNKAYAHVHENRSKQLNPNQER